MRRILYALLQCTWGILQTFAGFVMFLVFVKSKHFYYHGAIVTVTPMRSSVSLGMFVFVTENPPTDRRTENRVPDSHAFTGLLVHEYGHTIQSLILGPLYLLLVGVPSALWGVLPECRKKRQNGTSYYSFITEKSANKLGEKASGDKSMGDAVI